MNKGFKDFKDALYSPSQWLFLGFFDIKLRYRRSIIGPFWVTISTGIMISMLSFLWSHIFGADIKTYMPFFATGFVIWGWISSQISDASNGFGAFQGIIKQVKLPFSIFIFRLNIRQAIVLAHNGIIVLLVLIIIGPGLSLTNFVAIPGLLLVQLILTFASISIAIFCSRFQDMSQVVNVFTQIIFFFTPILWQIESLKNRLYLAEWNPIYHWIQMIRSPLLGTLPSLNDLWWSLGSLIFAFLLAAFMLDRYNSRIAYWL